MEVAARVLGVKLQILKARDPDTIDDAFLGMSKERTEALVVIPDALYVQHRARILKHAAKNRRPAIYPSYEFVENGGLCPMAQTLLTNTVGRPSMSTKS
jgi:putative ABC transport system substrate-binding protein